MHVPRRASVVIGLLFRIRGTYPNFITRTQRSSHLQSLALRYGGADMTQTRYCRNEEPTIAELLNDPVAHLLMARDGIQVRDVVAIVERAKDSRDAAIRAKRFGVDARRLSAA
jgi:hypothetical protein